jgi:glycine hydroxymethyltransferase
MDEIRRLALESKPKIIIAGYSAYSRSIDFAKFREIADQVGALLMVDMAHISGLVAGGAHASPFPHAHIVTSTTHKTLRGPRSGMILCHPEYAKKIDSAVFPGLQGGPLMHVIAAKAVMFKEALEPDFKNYAAQVVKNAKAMALALEKKGYRIVSGGTDNHLFVVDLSPKGITGKEAQEALDKSGINANRNTIPFDKQSPFVTSGVRLGSAAVTTRGMKESEMQEIADCIDEALVGRTDASKLHQVHHRVATLCNRFPIYAGERG